MHVHAELYIDTRKYSHIINACRACSCMMVACSCSCCVRLGESDRSIDACSLQLAASVLKCSMWMHIAHACVWGHWSHRVRDQLSKREHRRKSTNPCKHPCMRAWFHAPGSWPRALAKEWPCPVSMATHMCTYTCAWVPMQRDACPPKGMCNLHVKVPLYTAVASCAECM